MSFTTIPGSSSADATSFIGSAGIDVVALNNVGTPVWLGAQASGDQISFASATRSVIGYTLRGGQGNDQLVVGDDRTSLNQSWINLNKDNDTLSITGASTSSILGGQGNDNFMLAGAISSSLIRADQNNDNITLFTGASLLNATINGNAGDDTITVQAISSSDGSTLFGGQGNDTINASIGTVGVVMQGDAGNNQLSGGSGIDTFVANAGINAITNLGQGGADVITIARDATANATVITSWVATAATSNQGNAVLISGSAGINIDVTLATGNIGWTLQDSSGDERLEGSGQSDTIHASSGSDIISGEAGNDSITGGSGNDNIFGNEGADQINAGADDDYIQAGQDDDSVTGGLGSDLLEGGSTGRDQLSGDQGNDTIVGFADADTLSGGADSDQFGRGITNPFGLSGSSVIASSNTFTAGGIIAGDTITFATTVAGNVDRVTDFNIGIDKLDVIAGGIFPTNLVGIPTATSLVLGVTYVAYGNYNTNTGEFVIAGGYSLATPDALVVIGNNIQTVVNSTGYQVMTGLAGALTTGDFI